MVRSHCPGASRSKRGSRRLRSSPCGTASSAERVSRALPLKAPAVWEPRNRRRRRAAGGRSELQGRVSCSERWPRPSLLPAGSCGEKTPATQMLRLLSPSLISGDLSATCRGRLPLGVFGLGRGARGPRRGTEERGVRLAPASPPRAVPWSGMMDGRRRRIIWGFKDLPYDQDHLPKSECSSSSETLLIGGGQREGVPRDP